MENKFIVFNICATIFIIGIAIGTMKPEYQRWSMSNVISTSSCEGVEVFFSNTTFGEDLGGLYQEMGYNYVDDGFDIKPLNEMDAPTWDCEDRTHAVWCLSREYNLDCNIYTISSIGSMTDIPNHIGIECFVNGNWIKLE